MGQLLCIIPLRGLYLPVHWRYGLGSASLAPARAGFGVLAVYAAEAVGHAAAAAAAADLLGWAAAFVLVAAAAAAAAFSAPAAVVASLSP